MHSLVLKLCDLQRKRYQALQLILCCSCKCLKKKKKWVGNLENEPEELSFEGNPNKLDEVKYS